MPEVGIVTRISTGETKAEIDPGRLGERIDVLCDRDKKHYSVEIADLLSAEQFGSYRRSLSEIDQDVKELFQLQSSRYKFSIEFYSKSARRVKVWFYKEGNEPALESDVIYIEANPRQIIIARAKGTDIINIPSAAA